MGVEKGGRSMAANSEKTAKIRGPGKSGNPRGRPPPAHTDGKQMSAHTDRPPSRTKYSVNETISGIFLEQMLSVGGGPVPQNPLP